MVSVGYQWREPKALSEIVERQDEIHVLIADKVNEFIKVKDISLLITTYGNGLFDSSNLKCRSISRVSRVDEYTFTDFPLIYQMLPDVEIVYMPPSVFTTYSGSPVIYIRFPVKTAETRKIIANIQRLEKAFLLAVPGKFE